MKETHNALIEALLESVEKPARYTGGEMNTELKPRGPDTTAFALCFPDVYEVGMSHLGMKILCHVLNAEPQALCERVFMPWTDMAGELRQAGVPLFSLETRTPLRDFDLVGFTLQYEMSYTNILEMLDLGGIAVFGRDRGPDAPIVVAGGPCAFNPEPLSSFIDAFLLGDGETGILEMTRLVGRMKREGRPRREIIEALSSIEGVYVPSLYEASYHADGRLKAFTPRTEETPARVRKRIEADLDAAAYPDSIPLPYLQVVHDRIVLEIMRGCGRGCRFCQAGMIYRPVRERSLETLFRLAESLVEATGYEEISLSSLSSGDYSKLAELVEGLMDRFRERRVSLSLPSLRLDSLVRTSLQQSRELRKTGLTLAPEAGTQKLRDIINKGVTDEDLVRAVRDAFESGWDSVKLYFMIGLPAETDEDIDGIASAVRLVTDTYHSLPRGSRPRSLKVTVSVATFIPKPFTPFQWEAQDTLDTVRQKQARLREILSMKGVVLNWHDAELSLVEACLSRGDRRIGEVIHAAWKLGCRLDGWSEHFRFDRWLEAFERCGLDPAFYAGRARERDEVLPWDFIDAGVTRDFLWHERLRALEGAVMADCREQCAGCGIHRLPGVCCP